jgi:Protein tyrosine and serine/threonine kinase
MFGATLVEIFSRDTPFPDLDMPVAAMKIIEGVTPEVPEEEVCGAAVRGVMLDCFQYRASDRPTFAQIVKRLDG